MKRVVDLFLHPKRFKDRRRPIVKMNAVARTSRDLPHHLAHAISRRAIVYDHFIDLFGEEVADGSLHQIRFFETRAGAGSSLMLRSILAHCSSKKPRSRTK